MRFSKASEQRGRVMAALGNMRHQLALVLGAAQAARKSAETALARLRLEQQVVRAGITKAAADESLAEALRHPEMAGVADQLNAVHDAFYAEAATVPGKLRQLVGETAPGPAS